MTGSASTHLNEEVAERGVTRRHSGGLTNGWCDQKQTAETEEVQKKKKNTRVASFSFHRGMSVILGSWQTTFSSRGFCFFISPIKEWCSELLCAEVFTYRSICCVGDLCFSVSVPVRGGPADRSDAVVLGVSEPPLHWHALSFGETAPPPALTHTHTLTLTTT